jgi:hypothetical protein
MFDTQAKALEDALARRPRGLKTGDMIEYEEDTLVRRYWVMAIQQWMAKGAPHAVGLVWVSHCPSCGERWFQTTETRPQSLAGECAACDIVGSAGPALDRRVADDLTKLTEVCLQSGGGERPALKRWGRIETHVLEIGAAIADKGVALEEFVQRAADTLRAPPPNKRDTRPQHVRRALQNVSREPNGPMCVKDGLVVFTG